MAVPAEFTHLHVASSYSLRYGTATPAALAARAAEHGMSALALTDRDGLYGAFKHIRACADAGIKPLLGVDMALRADNDGSGPAGRITLLAVGRQGWTSLCRLVSAAHVASPARQGTGAGAGPVAVTVNGCECWDLPALEEIRLAHGMAAVRAAMAAGDVGPGTCQAAKTRSASGAAELTGPDDAAGQPEKPAPVPAEVAAAVPDGPARPVIFGNGFILSAYAETGAPGGNLKNPPRALWHASPGSTTFPG